jgi:ribonuclease BN (tRNA processing enzyme)
VDCAELTEEGHPLELFFKKELNIKLKTVQVIHSYPTYGVVIEHPDWKFIYSGDTRPSHKLIDAGKDATLLVHESNFEEDMAAKATTDRFNSIYRVDLIYLDIVLFMKLLM